ncbi:transcriptional repressor [Fulvivirga sp. M361]|uniref:Fur family transcriptional regulator n=1 Tax=Fulvivirga sp. M361 TaxID=2594266 RepID=UPI00117A4009|nr:transcriptional repressor [Fulvivirga sp. M361]TRX51735.1 transcriptional repressor [Fulvivirga sp. M361]
MDNKGPIGDLLHTHGLKKTFIRTEMLELFMEHDVALSASDIVAKMTARHDRVTIYRALSSFEEHGIVHRASEDRQGIKYAMCSSHCVNESHTDKHAHFVCDECHQTYCLEDVEVPEVEVSNEFSVHRINYTIGGVCKVCKA